MQWLQDKGFITEDFATLSGPNATVVINQK